MKNVVILKVDGCTYRIPFNSGFTCFSRLGHLHEYPRFIHNPNSSRSLRKNVIQCFGLCPYRFGFFIDGHRVVKAGGAA